MTAAKARVTRNRIGRRVIGSRCSGTLLRTDETGMALGWLHSAAGRQSRLDQLEAGVELV